jgi:dipeptidase E
LHQRRILPLLRQKILAGLPLVAFSAGTTLCGVDILASNDMNVCATINFSALGLLPYTFNVHYPARERAQAKRDKWLQDYHRFHPHPILALEDSAYLRVQAGEMVLKRGNCWLFAKDDDGRRRFEHAVFHEFG